MPTNLRIFFCFSALFACSCKKEPPNAPPRPALAIAADPERATAIADLQHDLAAARSAIAAGRNPSYALDRMQIATHALADDRDDGVLKLLAEAETIYGLQGPVAYAESKLGAIEKSLSPDGGAPPRAEDCAAVRDMLNRVGAKFNARTDVQSIVQRWKTACPKELRRNPRGDRPSSGWSGSSSSSSSAANTTARRDDCRRRCDDAGFSCRSSCPVGCTTDKTWDFCNARNTACRESCEQNEKFCRASCGE